MGREGLTADACKIAVNGYLIHSSGFSELCVSCTFVNFYQTTSALLLAGITLFPFPYLFLVTLRFLFCQ